jgi:hypothetical protein
MCILKECLLSNLCAEWFTAFGTILLSIVTVWITYSGDSATRLFRKKMNYDFQRKAFIFLKKIVTKPDQTSDISKYFYNEIVENKIYLSKIAVKKLDEYIQLSEKLGKEWSHGNDTTQMPAFRSVVTEATELVKEVGDLEEIKSWKIAFPDYFK